MKQEEILEYNKRCAEFLGWKETTEQFKIDWVGCKTKERLDRLNKQYIPILEKNGDVLFPDFSVINFHSDWNWIMEVVEAIENRGIVVLIGKNTCVIEQTYGKTTIELPSIKKNSKKEAVVEAINQFLNWYNENN